MWLHFYNLALLTKLSHPPILSFFRIFELETSVNCDKGREGAAFKISLYNICCRLPSGSILQLISLPQCSMYGKEVLMKEKHSAIAQMDIFSITK